LISTLFAPAPKPDTAASAIVRVADTSQKVGFAAFAAVNLTGSGRSAQPKFGGWLSDK